MENTGFGQNARITKYTLPNTKVPDIVYVGGDNFISIPWSVFCDSNDSTFLHFDSAGQLISALSEIKKEAIFFIHKNLPDSKMDGLKLAYRLFEETRGSAVVYFLTNEDESTYSEEISKGLIKGIYEENYCPIVTKYKPKGEVTQLEVKESKLEILGFDTSVQNIYFDRSPGLRRLASLKAKSIGFNLVVPCSYSPELGVPGEVRALHDFMDSIPSFAPGSAFYISSHFAMRGEGIPRGCELATYIKKLVKDSKVFLVTMFSDDFKEEIKNGIIDGVFGKDLIYDIPLRMETLPKNEQIELKRLIESEGFYLRTLEGSSRVESDPYRKSISEKMRVLDVRSNVESPTHVEIPMPLGPENFNENGNSFFRKSLNRIRSILAG